MTPQEVKSSTDHTVSEHRPAAIQVVCLGSGGGPSEDNVSGFLVRSVASGWVRGSILAVDAGTHLAAITRILEKHLPAISRDQVRADSDGNLFHQQALSPQAPSFPTSSPPSSPLLRPQPKLEPIVLDSGPFAGVPLPHASARANAAHIVRSHVAAYLISHPHLDHLSGFAINTAAFHATSRPKTLAALPFTVEAIKKHIFNDVIWPNLTDEDGGVGFVTFQRLKEGGDIMVGEGEGRGYIEVCEGLSTKAFKISHGKCMRPGTTESHRGSLSNLSDIPSGYAGTPKHYPSTNNERPMSLGHLHLPGTPGSYASMTQPNTSHPFHQDPNVQAVDSTAYFIRDIASSRELLMFGDVEPDSISVAPRLARVWAEAAPKIASGSLTGIFIECSYDDSQNDAVLFGHLAPRHVIAELQTLAEMVREERAQRASEKAMRKRKRMNGNAGPAFPDADYYLEKKRSRSLAGGSYGLQFARRSSVPEDALGSTPSLPRGVTSVPADSPGGPDYLRYRATHGGEGAASPMSRTQSQGLGQGSQTPTAMEPPLKGVRVLIMHVKDTMKDGPHVGDLILQQLNDHAASLAHRGGRLGCTFGISEAGSDYWF
ncbi:1-phosphatidylinositol 4,5-bisphosphate phosphodiesterase 1 [Sphaceloma murrayae]|uniref:1-phosphatidylinositol 4,5-bisphosphate phosphodiesterase 1 n=1 Tax=Sphaceloma murrayae TaxID=2082308 RepID=A0A2K1QT88_9PEZI|nr:1-phosphatidylinositol 4,5-bisphosphate phosphodiesterase 1 [Sphaceloma murrayae]